jgi:hypothetical protein
MGHFKHIFVEKRKLNYQQKGTLTCKGLLMGFRGIYRLGGASTSEDKYAEVWGSKEFSGIYLQLRKDKKKLRHDGRESSAEGEKWSESIVQRTSRPSTSLQSPGQEGPEAGGEKIHEQCRAL